MALSGNIATAAWQSQSGSTWKVVLYWTATQNVEKNTSTINWELKASTSASGYVVISELRVKFGGEQIYYRNSSYHTNAYNGTLLASGQKVITHNNDGTKSFAASVEAGIYNWAINKSGSGTIALNTIPRASSVSCTVSNIGGYPVISITRAASSFTHTLRYEFKGLTGTIISKTTSVSYSGWQVPSTFYAKIPDSITGTGTIYCDTYNGSTLIGTKSCPFTVRVINSNPTFTITMRDSDAETTNLTGNTNSILRYYSDVSYQINATAKNGASIKNYKIVNGSNTKTTASGTFYDVSDGVFQVSVTDSRGLTTSRTYELSLIEYVKISCNVWLKSVNAEGKAVLGVSGNYYNGSFGLTDNELKLHYEYKIAGESGYNHYATVTPTINGNTYEAEVVIEGLDYTKTYSLRFLAYDLLRSVYSADLPIRCIPVFDWGEDDFNFNVPIQLNNETVLRHNADANNIVLSSSGGFIYMRPKGTNDNTTEVKITPQGNIDLAGDIIIEGKSLKSILRGLGASI